MSRPFNATVLPKCRDRLSKAKRAAQLCRGARSFEEFESYWSDFLIHAGGVLNALDAGSATTPQGRQWYGGIKRAGRADPLVTYVHQARNAEEHPDQPTMRHEPGYIGIGAPGATVHIDNLTVGPEFLSNPSKYLEGRAWEFDKGGQKRTPTVVHKIGGPALAPVFDRRFKKTFPPPTEHQGKKLADSSPVAVAALFLTYLDGLVWQAADLS